MIHSRISGEPLANSNGFDGEQTASLDATLSPFMDVWNEVLKAGLAAVGGALGAFFALQLERGKVAAMIDIRSKKLDLILTEVEAVQKVQISMSGHEWNRQTMWREKRDAYAKLLSAAHAVLNILYAKAEDEFDHQVWPTSII